MSFITLISPDSQNVGGAITRVISWDTLFAGDVFSGRFIVDRHNTVEVFFKNDILVIKTSCDIDIIFNCHRPLPISGLYIKTAGYLEITGLPMNLNFGLWATADDIQVDAAIRTRGFVFLDVAAMSSTGVMQNNGAVSLNEKVEADRLIILTHDLNINSHVSANLAMIKFDALNIESLAQVCVGDKQVVFKNRITNSNVTDLAEWNEITKPTSKLTPSNFELRWLSGRRLTNKGTLKLYRSELNIDDEILHEALSLTVYEDMNVFCSGIITHVEGAVISGSKAFIKFEKYFNMDGDCKIDCLTIVGGNLNVNGLLDGGKQLNVQLSGLIQNKGLISSEKTNVAANNIMTTLVKNDKSCIFGFFKKGGIVGTQSLNINALGVLIAGGGYLYSPSVQSRTAFFANFAGMVCAFNFVNRSIFILDFGINAPCSPSSLSDLLNFEKMLRLSCRVMGNSFPMLRNAATFGTLAAPLGKLIKSTATSTADCAYNAAYGLYDNPNDKLRNGVSAVNDFKNSMFEGGKAGLDTMSKAAKVASSSSKEDFIQKVQESMKQVSESWSETRWLELLNYLLTMQDWYISADMIMTQGTSALVFANDAKTCLKSPSATLEGITNNFATTLNNAKETLADPSLASNFYDASIAQVEELRAIPKNAVNKLYSQGVGVVDAVTNPLETANKLSGSLGNAVNSITLENAKKGMLDPLLKKKRELLEVGNTLCYGADPMSAINEENCSTTQPKVPLASNIEEDSADATVDTQTTTTNDTPATNDKPALDKKKISPFKQTLLDVAVMFAPSVDRRSAISVSGGITISGSVMEDNLFNSHNGVTAAISSSNYSLFGFHNSGGIYSSYRNEVVGNRYNTGDVHVGAMHLNAGNNEEHGDFQYSEFIFDIARDFNTDKKTRMSDTGYIHGTVNGDFYGASDFSMSSGHFAVKGSYILEKGASHTIGGDAQFTAKNADVYGNLETVKGAKVHFENGAVHDGGKYSINGATHTGDSLIFKRGGKFVFSSGKAAIKDNYLVEDGACSSVSGDAQLYAKNGNIFGALEAIDKARVHFDAGIIHDGGKYTINGATHAGNDLTIKNGAKFVFSKGNAALKDNFVVEKGASSDVSGDAQLYAKNGNIFGDLAALGSAKVHFDYGTVHDGGKYAIDGATHTGNDLTIKTGAKFVLPNGNAALRDSFVVEKGAHSSVSGDAQLYAKDADVYGDLAAMDDAIIHFDNGVIHGGGKYSINRATHAGDSLTFKPDSIIDIIEDIMDVNTLDDQGATVYAENHITFAKKFTRSGNWTYKGFLHEQLDDAIETTLGSTLEKFDSNATYSLQSKTADLKGAEKHSYVQASIDDMTTSEAVDYALGKGKYAGIDVTEYISVLTESSENAEYAGGRANGAHVQVQTKGRITLPPRFNRAQGMTFTNYEEADYFVRAVYATHNLPPPQPKKRKGIKKHLDQISNAFATVAAVFAGGGNPITAIISGVSASIALGADKLDKHYDRKDSRYLEQLELERARLQQKLDLEGLSMQEKSVLASLTNQDHMRRVNSAMQRLQNVDNSTYNDVISNTWSLEAARQQAVQQVAASRQELNDQNSRQLADISYHHARHRDDLSRLGGPVIGTGLAINAGSTGVTTSLTITAGNPGQAVTGRIPIANHDFNRPAIGDAQGSELPRARPREPLSQAEAVRAMRGVEDRFPGLLGGQQPIPQLVPVNFSGDERLILAADTGQNRNNIGANDPSNRRQLSDTELQGALSALQAANSQLNDRSYLNSPDMQHRSLVVNEVENNIVIHTVNQFEEKPLMQVLFAAIDGNIGAKKEMRKRATTLAKFFDSIDPELRIKASDSAVMAELKMYGRAAKGLRDQFIHTVNNLDELVTRPFIFGADVIEAGLYYYAGKEYYPAARERNYARMAAFDQLLHADGLTQREAILTMGLAAMAGGIIMAPRIPLITMPRPILPAFRLRDLADVVGSGKLLTPLKRTVHIVKNNKAGLLFNFERQFATINASSPGEIYRGYGNLSARQQSALDLLPKNLSRLKLHKSDINVNDLAALTAYTGDEFALFTRGSQRLVIRGNRFKVDLLESEIKTLELEGFRWSAHTHPGAENIKLDASGGDRYALELMQQDRSLILNSMADKNVFDAINNIRITEFSRDVTKFQFAEWNPITKVKL